MVNRSPCFIIAEAGVNHNGSEELALKLIDVACEAGADAIKFQTFDAKKLASSSAKKAAYQVENTGAGNQLEMLQALELSMEAHQHLLEHCQNRNIEFMSTAFDEESAKFLVDLGIKRIKIPSGEITNKPFIEFLAGFDLPLIVSTGMATLTEVEEAITWIRLSREQAGFKAELSEMVTVLHCTSNYPTKPADVNLMAMVTMGRNFQLPIGFSDHTLGYCISCSSVALGATVVEKHVTLDRSMEGPDHQASLEPEELSQMVAGIREVEQALGDGVKSPRESELPVRAVARKSITLTASLQAGQSIQPHHLVIMRPGHGIPPKELDNVVGKRLKADVSAGETLLWEMID